MEMVELVKDLAVGQGYLLAISVEMRAMNDVLGLKQSPVFLLYSSDDHVQLVVLYSVALIMIRAVLIMIMVVLIFLMTVHIIIIAVHIVLIAVHIHNIVPAIKK